MRSPRNPLLADVMAEFRRYIGQERRLAVSTLEELDYRLARYKKLWPDLTVREFDTVRIAAFLNTLTPASYVKNRRQLLDLFQYCCHNGYIEQNPVALTLVKAEGRKVRRRHTEQGVAKILSVAPAWLRRAINLALWSLQRREDLVVLQRTQVALDAGTLTVLQLKTRNYKNPVFLEIVMGTGLRAAVEACLGSGISCPYLLHYKPLRMTRQVREAKLHPFAVDEDYLSREFSRVRDECRAYADLRPEERPTFHELRALGMHRYKEAGFDQEYITALSGHSTEAMYQRYLRDHEQLKPRRVEAGLPEKAN